MGVALADTLGQNFHRLQVLHTVLLSRVCRLVTFWWRNDGISDPDQSALKNFGDKTAAVKECFLETLWLTAKFVRPVARIAVLDATKRGSADFEFTADEP